MPAGARPGERRGGRAKGVKNLRTVERELIAEKTKHFIRRDRSIAAAERDAMVAAQAVQEASALNTDLAKDTLDTFKRLFVSMAASYQPEFQTEVVDGKRVRKQIGGDIKQFEHWARLAVDVAAKLAPYQSPTMRAIVVSPPPPQQSESKRFTLAIFDHHNGGADIVAAAIADEIDNE